MGSLKGQILREKVPLLSFRSQCGPLLGHPRMDKEVPVNMGKEVTSTDRAEEDSDDGDVPKTTGGSYSGLQMLVFLEKTT